MEDWQFEPAHDLGISPIARLRSLRRESGLVSTTMHISWWALVRSYLRVWHRLQIVGAEYLPAKPPFVMIANHTSHLDAMVLAAPFSWRIRDRVYPIAASDTFFEDASTTVFAAGMLNALPISRANTGHRAMIELRQKLTQESAGFILFPEGTRSRTGTLLSFKPGLGMLVAGTNVPVVPCFLSGCYSALPPDRRMPKRSPIQLIVGEAHQFADVPCSRDGWLKIVATLEAKVRALDPSSQSNKESATSNHATGAA